MKPARKKTQRPASIWTTAAYKATNDITVVAIYRMASGVMGLVLLGMLGYFGNRLVAGEDELRADVAALRVEIISVRSEATGAIAASAELKGQVNMDHLRGDRTIDRLNATDSRVTALEAKLDLLMPGRR